MRRKEAPALERAADAEVAQLVRGGLMQLLYRRGWQQPVPPLNVPLDLPSNRLLKEILRTPLKMQYEADVIVS